jgi:PEP-CTERM motif
MKTLTTRAICAAALALGAAAPALAAGDLTGKTVDVKWLFGDPAASIAERSFTVGSGVELTCAGGTVGPDLCQYFLDGATIDVSATDLRLTITSGSSYWGASAFNGYLFSGLAAGGSWLGYTLDTTFAGLDASRIAFTPDSISVNMQSIQPVAGQYFDLHLDAVAPVPEPESYALLLAGLGVMGLIARRRRR